MYPASSLCREQETLQHARAAASTLENVRIVATRAALAWGEEARAAEKREARHLRTRETAAAASAEEQSAEPTEAGLVEEAR